MRDRWTAAIGRGKRLGFLLSSVACLATPLPALGDVAFNVSTDPADWTVDRYAPQSVTAGSYFGRDDVLKMTLGESGYWQNRPHPGYTYSPAFYSSQGIKTRTDLPAGPSFVAARIYIPASWQQAQPGVLAGSKNNNVVGLFQTVGFWGTVGVADVRWEDFPAAGFTNQNQDGTFRFATPGEIYVYPDAVPVIYDGWNDLRIEYRGDSIVYLVNGAEAFSYALTVDPGDRVYEIILQAYNNSTAPYDVYWADIRAGFWTPEGQPVVIGDDQSFDSTLRITDDVLQAGKGNSVCGNVEASNSSVSFGQGTRVCGSVLSEESDVSFGADSEIGGDIVALASSIALGDDGSVGGDVYGYDSSVSLGAGVSVGGDLVLEAGSTLATAGARIGGGAYVDATSTLGGNVDIDEDLVSAGLLSPGNSPGIVNVGGDYDALPGATALLEADLTAASPVAGVDYDQVNVAGNVTGTTTVYLQPLNGSNSTPIGDLGQVELVTVGGTVGPDAFVQGNRVVQYGHDILLQQRQEGGGTVLGLTSIVADESYVLASLPSIVATSGTVFLGSYVDRRGLDWEGRSATWMRVVGGGFSLDKDTGVGVSGTLVGTQVGVDLIGLPFHGTDRGETRIGVTVGYGHVWSDIDRADNGESAGSTDGNQVAIGAYVTHAQDNFYADLLTQYRFLSYSLDAPQTSGMDVKGGSFDLAAEVGAPLPVAEGLTLVPSAQLVYQHIMLDGYSDANFDATYSGDDVLTGALNLLAQGDFAGVRPFGELGVSWDFLGDQSTTVSGYEIETDGGGAQAQIALGVEGEVLPNFNLYLAGQYNVAFDGDQQIYVGTLGGRYRF